MLWSFISGHLINGLLYFGKEITSIYQEWKTHEWQRSEAELENQRLQILSQTELRHIKFESRSRQLENINKLNLKLLSHLNQIEKNEEKQKGPLHLSHANDNYSKYLRYIIVTVGAIHLFVFGDMFLIALFKWNEDWLSGGKNVRIFLTFLNENNFNLEFEETLGRLFSLPINIVERLMDFFFEVVAFFFGISQNKRLLNEILRSSFKRGIISTNKVSGIQPLEN